MYVSGLCFQINVEVCKQKGASLIIVSFFFALERKTKVGGLACFAIIYDWCTGIEGMFLP